MPAPTPPIGKPNAVTVNPGVKLLTGTLTTTGLTYTNGNNNQTRTRITSVTLCDVTKAGVTVTINVGGTGVLFQYAMPTDGSPFTLTLNETIDAAEVVTLSASANSAVGVRMTGEEIFVE